MPSFPFVIRHSSFVIFMFEREIQRAKELLTQRLAAAQQFVYWQEIRERADIPVFYRNFFGAEVQWWIFEEQLQRAANPRFDYAHEQLALHTVEADRYRMEAARFDHQDLTAAIDLAVKTRFNYILRPRTTLKWFVYRGEPTKTLSEVLLRMDYFLEYDYLLDGFRKWIATKQSEAPVKQPVRQVSLVSIVEFDRTLQNVDNDVILEYSPEEFTDLLTPIYEMFDEIHATDRALHQYRGKVPMPAIIVFLDDKGIYRIAQELEDVMKKRALRYVGQREFLHLLNDIVSKLEQETPLPPSEHADALTLPLAFDDEPIIKADDTIGELALGAAKRKPKQGLQADVSLENVTVEDAPEQLSVTHTPIGATALETAENHPVAIAPAPSNDDTLHHAFDNANSSAQELSPTFGTELAGLAEMMQEFQTAPSRERDAEEQSVGERTTTVTAALQSASQAEIHDAEYVMMQSEEESGNDNNDAEAKPHETIVNTPSNTEKTPLKTAIANENEPPKSSLFTRWSSIFTPRTEE